MLKSLVDVEETRSNTQTTLRSVNNGFKPPGKMPLSAVAGLQGKAAEKFECYKMGGTRMIPVTHCWTPAGEILVGCLDGELLKVSYRCRVNKPRF